ncbi:hypothetical protein ACXZ65_20365 [Streptomyces aculeolatus]
MKEAEIRAHFDGRSPTTLRFRGLGMAHTGRALVLAHHFGYELVSAANTHKGEYTMVFRLDNSPQGRQRAAHAAHTPLPAPGQPPQRGWSPVPVHAGGTWVSPGEAAGARRNIAVRGDRSPAPLVIFFSVGAAVMLAVAWNLHDDSTAGVIAVLVLSALLVAAASFAPRWLSRMKRRDAELVARYERQQAQASGVLPPRPPPPAPPPQPGQPDPRENGS